VANDLATVKIVGLKEFNSRLRKLDGQLPKMVRVAFNSAASIVVDDARPHIPVVTGAAKGSVRVASTRTAARIRGGGSKAPYYPWLDFGGYAGRGKTLHRPFLPDGRYIYNSFYRKRPQFIDQMVKALRGIAHHVGLQID
jgi:hypothetical protein